MKHLTSVILFILLSGQMVWGQEDEKAAGILERMAKKYQQIEAFSADFSQSMINEQEGINESFTGKGIIKKNKYKIEVAGRTLYNNGREIWTYSPDDEEVTISPVSDEEEIDPTFIFSNYKKDFKFRYLGETRLRGKMLQKVALFPRKPEGKSFFKIEVEIQKKNNEVLSFTSFDREGNKFRYLISNFKILDQVPDQTFEFDENKYPDVEIVDLR